MRHVLAPVALFQKDVAGFFCPLMNSFMTRFQPSMDGIQMAGTIGRITAALSSIHNENSLSLANLNFDFTLVKLEAPVEYQPLGTTISS
jgi:hypothetical protein